MISGQHVTALAWEALGARMLAAPGHPRGGEQLSAWGNLGLGHSCLGCLPWLCPAGRGLRMQCIPPTGRIHADRAEHVHKRRLLQGAPGCPSSSGKVALAEYQALDSDLGEGHTAGWWKPVLFPAVAWGYRPNEGEKCVHGGRRSGAGVG